MNASSASAGAGEFCADLNAHVPLAGTAPHVTGWVIIEADGPWGAKALLEGPLGPELGPELERRTAGTTARVQLARSPDRAAAARSRVWLASGGHVRAGELNDPNDLLGLDFAAIAEGTLPDLGNDLAEPLLFVCQNGRRDACCARLGRPLVASLAAEFPGTVWETNHLNGHRFAPTALLLPDGTLHGRLDLDAARTLLADAALGLTTWSHCRGRTGLAPAAQAAELAVREVLGQSAAADLIVTRVTEDSSRRWFVEVAHRDGRGWHVQVDAKDLPPRPESCNKAPVPATALTSTLIS